MNQVLARVELPTNFRGKGSCTHIQNGVDMTKLVYFLRAEKLNDTELYLYYEDCEGSDLNDLCFSSFGELLWQVANEYSFETAKLLQADATTRFSNCS